MRDNRVHINHTLQCLIDVLPPLISFWKFVTKKWSNFDAKGAISCQVIILYLDFVVRITSYVKTLMFDILSHTLLPPLYKVYF